MQPSRFMRAIRDIVVPVDLTEPREDAVVWAVDLAAPIGARVHLLHVYQFPVYALTEGQSLAIAGTAERDMDGLARRMDALVARHGTPAVRIDGHLVRGLPHVQIAKLAERLHASLVVMGTHARRGVDRFLLGSVAEKVIRRCRVPVLVLPPDADRPARLARAQ